MSEAQLTIDPTSSEAIGREIARLNRNSLLFGVLGLATQTVGQGMGGLVGSILVFTGAAILVYAFSLYARMRRQSPWWGLMGLLSCVGLVVLLFLPKKCHNCGTKTTGATCSNCGAPAPK